MKTNRDLLLMELLDCGECDLSLLDDVGYDWCDIISADRPFPSSISGLMRQVIRYGQTQLEEAISDRICELEAIPNEREVEEDEEQELAELRELNPIADIKSSFNYLDTYIWCIKNKEIYHKYLQKALDNFAYGTGFVITMG